MTRWAVLVAAIGLAGAVIVGSGWSAAVTDDQARMVKAIQRSL